LLGQQNGYNQPSRSNLRSIEPNEMNKRVFAMIPANGFRNRTAAGQDLAQHLSDTSHREQIVVLALPRGGVPVAREIAQALDAPLDIFVVRKLGLPGQPEFSMGAIATGGVQLIDDALIAEAKIPAEVVSRLIEQETVELKRREALYRGGRSAPDLANRSIILVDDGVATGYTMRVAILALRQLNPSRLTVAIPIGAPETCALLEGLVDELICPVRPSPFHAVGLWYDHFPAVTDKEVCDGIAEAAREATTRGQSARSR
jgi:putative phosphoribosyl transferase